MDIGYSYEFVSKVPEEYVCGICQLPMRKPVQTKCGHRFYRECLLEANKRISRKHIHECPMDRQPLYNRKEEELFEDKAVERSILSLIVKCPNTGCQWQGELINIENHKPKCEYRIVRCTSEYCDIEKPLIEMRVHTREECEWRQVTCSHCGETIISRELEEHKKHCPEFPVECLNQCGQTTARKQVKYHIDNDCPKSVVSCSYRELGCTFKDPREYLNNHLKNDTKDHLSLVLDYTTQFQEEFKQRVDFVEQNSKTFKRDLQLVNQELKSEQRKHKTWTSELIQNQFQEKLKQRVDFVEQNSKYMKRDLQSVNQELKEQQRKHRMLTSELKDAKKQTRWLDEDIKKIESELKQEKQKKHKMLASELKNIWRLLVSIVIGMIAILVFTSRQIAGTSTELTHLREKLESKAIWNVNNERSFVKDFYTGRYGYKLRIAALRRPRISPRKEEHFFSFAVAVLRGEYDPILPWPFNQIIKVTLLDQNENPKARENVAVVIDPKEYHTSKYLNRPSASLSIPFVFREITLEEHLNATSYFFKGSLFLLIETENEGDLVLH